MTGFPACERRLLEALCSRTVSNESRKAITARLREYTWRDPEHRIIYEALERIAARGGRGFREGLAAEATRMGFPDVNWERYFGGAEATLEDVEALVTELVRPRTKPE